MHLDVRDHRPDAGWSRPPDSSLDSDRTLVLAFGPSSLLDGARPLADLAQAFPRACIVGCSTSGAIHDTRIDDDRLVVAVARFDGVRLRSAVCRVDDPAGSFGAGEHLARTLCDDGLRAVKEYLGERASGLPATALLFPLTLWSDEAGDDPSRRIVRTVLAVNEADQSMVFAGDLPVGHHAQMMYANFDRLVHGAGEAALAARGDESRGDLLALAVSCVGRRLVLGDRAEEEVEAIRDVLPGKVRPIGFYSYGDLSPVDGGACDLHNQTMTLTTLAEG